MRHVVRDSKRLMRSAKFAVDVTAATVAQIAVRRHLIDRPIAARPIPLSVPNIVAALIAGHTYRHRLVKRTPSETMIMRPMRTMGASPKYPAQRRRDELPARGRASARVRLALGHPRPSTLCQTPLAASQS